MVLIREINPLGLASDSHNTQISFTLNTLLQSDLLFRFTVLPCRFTTSLTTSFNNVFLQLNLVHFLSLFLKNVLLNCSLFICLVVDNMSALVIMRRIHLHSY